MSPVVDMTVAGVAVLSNCKSFKAVHRHLDERRGLCILKLSSITYKQFQHREMSPFVDMTAAVVAVLSNCKAFNTVHRHLDPECFRERGLYTRELV
jgi:hypothetical protein